MPKSPRRPSESSHYRKRRGESNSPALTGPETEEYAPNHISATSSFESSLRKLAITYRTAAVENLVRLAKEIEDNGSLPHAEKIAALLETVFAVSEILGRLSRTAPDKAPELWENRLDKSENAFEFTRRVYKEYIERGLSKPDIFKLDRKLYQAIQDRQRRHADDSLVLRSQREVTDSLLSELGNEVSLAGIVDSLPEVFRRRMRLYRAVTSRRHRSSRPKPK